MAITEGFDKLDEVKRWDLAQLPALEGDYESAAKPVEAKPPKTYDIEKNFDVDELELLDNLGFPRPSNFFEISNNNLENIRKDVKNDIKIYTGKIAGLSRKQNKSLSEETTIDSIKFEKDVLNKYKNTIGVYLSSTDFKVGEGLGGIYFTPHQLLNRLELLGGSILAGNNGVIPEFSQIAHLLNQMKVISKKQLNDLLKTYL